ncbi:MAG: MFS transporter, partial [Candidatus Nanopelagicaceae bacterium]
MFSRISPEGNWRALRHRNFRILYASAILTNIGTWAQRVAQDWLVLELTNNNGTYLGIVTALQFLPVMLLSLQGGVLADKVDKRKALIITNFGSGISALILGIFVITDVVTINHVYILAIALGVFSALDAPIRASFNVEVVGQKDLTNAMGLNSANFHFGRLVGPAISGFLIAAFGTGPSFLINAVSFFVVMLAFLAVRSSELHIEEKSPSDGTLKEAFKYIKKRPDIQVVMMTIFFAANFGLNMQIFNALMATKVFGKGAASYGILGTLVGVGTLTGALIAARSDRTKNTKFVPIAAINFGFWIAVLAFMPTFTVYALVLPISGISAITTMISALTFIQTNTDHAIRGRIMGIYMFIFMGGTPIGSPIIGYCAENFGVRCTMGGCGLITLTAAFYCLMKYRNTAVIP